MAQTGDTYIVKLKQSHLNWGEHRYTQSREPILGEGYIPIPREHAVRYNIFNSNNPQIGFGFNKFYATSNDGFLQNVILLAQGSSEAGDIYAKQFSVEGDLAIIGSWYSFRNATTENSVIVTWKDPTHITLDII